MEAARFAPKTALLVTALLVVALVFPNGTWAASGNVQVCQPSSNCHLGEFLFDDNYAPLTTTACVVTSKYPNGTPYLNQQSMTPNADGWYSYDASIDTTAGVYRTQICCTVGGYTFTTAGVNTSNEQITVNRNIATDTIITFSSSGSLPSGLSQGIRYYAINVSSTVIQVSATQGGGAIDLTSQGTGTHTINSDNMCLDKTFEVKADLTSNGIAASVWGYSDRSLSTFGTLISDIWNYSTRSLTTFGSLASDVWGSATRTLTGAGLTSGSLATLNDINSARDNIKGASNKDLSQLSTEVAGVKTDTASIVTTVGSIYTDTQALRTDVTSILNKWGTASAASIIADIDAISNKLGTNADLETASTIFGRVEYVRNKWGSQTAQAIYDKANSASTTVTSLRAELDYNGKTTTAYQDLQSLLGYVDSLETSVGVQSDASTASTLFGRMKKIQEKVDTLSVINADLRGILDSWGADNNIAALYTKVVDIRGKLDTIGTVSSTTNLSQTTINNIENISSVLNQTTITNTVMKELKNEVLTLSAVAQVSRDLIEKTVNKPIIKTFLLEGSIIFNSLAINPSAKVAQDLDFVYYLPEEIEKEHILELEEYLSVDFDIERGQYLVSGTVSLKPGETKTITVRTEDVWKISEEEINSLRTQTEELFKTTQGTAYFGQAVTIKGDINVSLDKVLELSKKQVNQIPEAKINTYRTAQIEINAIKSKIESLKEMVSQSSSAGNLLGFVGGAQVMAVWGMVILLAGAFAIVIFYLKSHNKNGNGFEHENPPSVPKISQPVEKIDSQVQKPNNKLSFGKFLSVLVGTVVVSSLISGYVTANVLSKNFEQKGEKQAKQLAEISKKPEVLGEAVESAKITGESLSPNYDLLCINKGELIKGISVILLTGADSSVKLYENPSVKSKVVREVTRPENGERLGEVGKWALYVSKNEGSQKSDICNDGKMEGIGWVEKERLVPTDISGLENLDDESMNEVETTENMVTILDTHVGYLNARKSPYGDVVGKLKAGEKFKYLSEKNGWIEVTLDNGEKAWISKQYVSMGSNLTD